jgi:hypothetical protein
MLLPLSHPKKQLAKKSFLEVFFMMDIKEWYFSVYSDCPRGPKKNNGCLLKPSEISEQEVVTTYGCDWCPRVHKNRGKIKRTNLQEGNER